MTYKLHYKASCLLTLMAPFAIAQVEVVEGRLDQLTPQFAEIVTAKGKLRVPVDSKSRYWHAYSSVPNERFPIGLKVVARVRFGEDEVLKEIADERTANWLTAIRKLPQPGRIISNTVKGLKVEFSDGTSFTYRVTEKSKATLGGKAGSAAELVPGQSLYFAARLLSNYDTWLREATDEAPSVRPSTASSSSRAGSRKPDAPPAPLPSSGEVEGVIVFFYPKSPIFDLLVEGQRYHITMTPQTQILVDGRKSSPNALDLDMEIRLKFRKDRFGRIIASRISTD